MRLSTHCWYERQLKLWIWCLCLRRFASTTIKLNNICDTRAVFDFDMESQIHLRGPSHDNERVLCFSLSETKKSREENQGLQTRLWLAHGALDSIYLVYIFLQICLKSVEVRISMQTFFCITKTIYKQSSFHVNYLCLLKLPCCRNLVRHDMIDSFDNRHENMPDVTHAFCIILSRTMCCGSKKLFAYLL